MSTQILSAKKNITTEEMEFCAKQENLPVEFIKEGVLSGNIVIIKNKTRKNLNPIAIGASMSPKTIIEIGVLSKEQTTEEIVDTARALTKIGVDCISDISFANSIKETRQALISKFNTPICSSPILQTAKEALQNNKEIISFTKERLFKHIEEQCKDGVDLITLHCGLTQDIVQRIKQQKRLMSIVSKSGVILASWMKTTKKENPLYKYFNEVLDILKQYNTTLCFGSTFTPGTILDSDNTLEMNETLIISDLIEKARKAGVQTIVKCGGNIPMEHIQSHIQTKKRICLNSPLLVSAPLVCDYATGYDHIAGAIGTSLATYHGADMILSKTAKENLSYPTLTDLKDALITTKIAIHSSQIALRKNDAIEKEKRVSLARVNFNFKEQKEYAFDKIAFDGIELPKRNDIINFNDKNFCLKLCQKYFMR